MAEALRPVDEHAPDEAASRDPFCANPACVLHVAPGDPDVEGHGHWAELPDGRRYGRWRVAGRYYCDPCARALEAGERAPLRR